MNGETGLHRKRERVYYLPYMDEFHKKKVELLRPLMFEAGAALYDCQGLEYGIALLLFHFARHGHPGLDLDALTRIMDNQDKKSLGQLIHMLKKNLRVSPGTETALKEGLDARNLIVHRVLVDNVESFPFPEKRTALIKEIRRLGRKVRDANMMLQPFIFAFSEALGVKQEEMEKEVKALFS
jgi:hypothetical protein